MCFQAQFEGVLVLCVDRGKKEKEDIVACVHFLIRGYIFHGTLTFIVVVISLCSRVCFDESKRIQKLGHIRTFTNTYIYIYVLRIYIYMCTERQNKRRII